MRDRREVIVKVFTINPFRLTMEGVDVPVTFGCIGHRDMLVTKEIKQSFDIIPAFEVISMRMDRPNKRQKLIHMIARLASSLSSELLFPERSPV